VLGQTTVPSLCRRRLRVKHELELSGVLVLEQACTDSSADSSADAAADSSTHPKADTRANPSTHSKADTSANPSTHPKANSSADPGANSSTDPGADLSTCEIQPHGRLLSWRNEALGIA